MTTCWGAAALPLTQPPYFGTTPDFWINLQARYDLDAAERKLRRRIEREVRPRAA